MQNRDDVDGSQRPQTADAPKMNTPANDEDLGGHLGAGGDPVEGSEEAVDNSDASDSSVAGTHNTPAKE